jgi:hypothetical protein
MISAEKGSELLFGFLRKVCEVMYGDDDILFIERVIRDVIDLFEGKREGFCRADTLYHDLEHTVQTVRPFVEIIRGWNTNPAVQPISRDFFDLGVVAVLLHDTGYVRRQEDTKGTGGKFTFVHIDRSIDFAGEYLGSHSTKKSMVESVQKAIRCTGVRADDHVPFDSYQERAIGHALGSADLLGQMAAENYITKLPKLFDEFAEAYEYEGRDKLESMGIRIFEDVNDLIRSTPAFYQDVAQMRLKKLGGIYEQINRLHEDGRNPYIEAIETNIGKIAQQYPAL